MNRILSCWNLICIAACASGAAGAAPSGERLPRQLVMDIVTFEVISTSPWADELVAFLYDPEGPDSTLAPGIPVGDAEGSFEFAFPFETYLVWLDNETTAEWNHPATYVIVDAFTGELFLQEGLSWPVVGGEELTRYLLEGNNAPEVFYGQYQKVNNPFDYVPVDRPNTTDWAIIVVGENLHGDGEREARRHDVKRIQEILNGASQGPMIDKDNIEVVDGGDLLGATKQQICDAISGVDPSCEKLWFFYIGHGSEGGRMKTKGEPLSYEELACKLIEAGVKEVCISIEACYSGNAVEDMPAKEIDGKKLKGVLVTSSSDGKTTKRIDCDGAPYVKGLNECYKDPKADLNGDGKVSMVEAVAWASAQDQDLVGARDPQAAILGDGRTIEFPKPKSKIISTKNANSQRDLKFDWRRIYYEYKEGVEKGEDPLVCTGRLYMFNPREDVPFEAKNSVDIICKKEDGTQVVLASVKPKLDKGERVCLLDVPADCTEIKIKKTPDFSEASIDLEDKADDEERAYYYEPGEFIFQEHVVAGTPGDVYSTYLAGPSGWNLSVEPAFFTVPALLPDQTLVIMGDVPVDAEEGAEILLQIVNESLPDTTELVIQALLYTEIPGDAGDGESFHYQALDLGGDIVSNGADGVSLSHSVALMNAPSGVSVGAAGMLSAVQTSFVPVAGHPYPFAIAGHVAWEGASLARPGDGLHLDGASGSIFDGSVLKSGGDGLVATGDLSGLDLAFFLVDSSAARGAVFDGATGAAFRNLSICNSGSLDLVLSNGSSVTLRDALFDDASTDIDGSSTLTRSWTTFVVCNDVTGAPVEGVGVEILDANGDPSQTAFTDPDGFSPGTALVQYIRTGDTVTDFTPHTVTVSFADWDSTLTHFAGDRAAIEIEIPFKISGTPPPYEPPAALLLEPSRPNPIRSSGTIRFDVPSEGPLTLRLFDSRGRMVREIAAGTRPARQYEIPFDRGDLPSGVYFFKLETGAGSRTRKLVIVD